MRLEMKHECPLTLLLFNIALNISLRKFSRQGKNTKIYMNKKGRNKLIVR